MKFKKMHVAAFRAHRITQDKHLLSKSVTKSHTLIYKVKFTGSRN